MNFSTKIKSLILLALTLFSYGYASASQMDVAQTNVISEKCGLTLVFSNELIFGREGRRKTCVGSFEATSGTVLSLAPLDSDDHDSNWIDRIPVLHIQNMGIDELIKKNGGGIFGEHSTGKAVRTAPAPAECQLQERSGINEISGLNWHGWIAEDGYAGSKRNSQAPEYCQKYSEINRCVRMVIGNKKMSATMSQYCLARDPKDFDLDGGLSYDIFKEIIKTIRFVRE